MKGKGRLEGMRERMRGDEGTGERKPIGRLGRGEDSVDIMGIFINHELLWTVSMIQNNSNAKKLN